MNLVKIRQISINYQNNKQIIANYMPELYENSGGYYELLGEYKTKERALEVLDEIEKTLKPQLTIKDNGKTIGPDDIRELYTSFEGAIIKEGATCELKEFSNFVYQMPAE